MAQAQAHHPIGIAGQLALVERGVHRAALRQGVLRFACKAAGIFQAITFRSAILPHQGEGAHRHRRADKHFFLIAPASQVVLRHIEASIHARNAKVIRASQQGVLA